MTELSTKVVASPGKIVVIGGGILQERMWPTPCWASARIAKKSREEVEI